MIIPRIRTLIAVTASAAVAALGVFALGAGSAPAAQPLHHRHHHHHSCIPQHNRGDHDADNRGGPSDGDGCM
jgi:hypothetical protein